MKIYSKFLVASTLFTATSVVLAGGMIFDDYDEYRGRAIEEEPVVEREVIEIEIEEEEEADPYWEIIAMGGTAQLDAENTTLDLTPIDSDTLSQTNDGDWGAWTVNLGLGYVIPLFDAEEYSDEVQWLTALEPQINGYYLQGNINGDIDRSASSVEGTEYSIGLNSTRVMFDLALTLASYRNLSVYAIAGIGPSWNDIDFRSKEVVPGCDITIDGGTDTNFAYEFGGGFTYAVTEDLGISLEYLYVGFNDLNLGDDADLDGFDLSDVETSDFDLSSQAVFLGLRYGF